ADGEDLGGESLVDVDHVDVLERQPRPVEGDRSRQRRPDEELPTRVDRRRGVGPDDRLRLVAEAAGGLLLHEDQGGGTVGERRGVAGGDGAVAAVEGRFQPGELLERRVDRKSTRLNSSHVKISYAVFCLKKKIEERI